MSSPLLAYLATRGIDEPRLVALNARFVASRGPVSIADMVCLLDLPLAEVVELLNDFSASLEVHH